MTLKKTPDFRCCRSPDPKSIVQTTAQTRGRTASVLRAVDNGSNSLDTSPRRDRSVIEAAAAASGHVPKSTSSRQSDHLFQDHGGRGPSLCLWPYRSPVDRGRASVAHRRVESLGFWRPIYVHFWPSSRGLIGSRRHKLSRCVSALGVFGNCTIVVHHHCVIWRIPEYPPLSCPPPETAVTLPRKEGRCR